MKVIQNRQVRMIKEGFQCFRDKSVVFHYIKVPNSNELPYFKGVRGVRLILPTLYAKPIVYTIVSVLLAVRKKSRNLIIKKNFKLKKSLYKNYFY